ncbi:MAG: alpha-D-ribose 1-methylphosphonate 5-triphosphate diphosphatase [Pseudomonadota bacterium]
MQNWVIENGTALIDGELATRNVCITDGVFSDTASANASSFDAEGCYVLPGIIDIHGDAFERIMEPRPGVFFDKEIALHEADRQMISNGITTAYHGLGVSWEPGVRDMNNSRAIVEAWSNLKDSLYCDTHLNLRWETFALDERTQALDWLERFPGSVLSVNDHASAFRGLAADHPRIIRMAKRIGISPEDAAGLLESLFARSEEVPGAVEETCRQAVKLGAKVFAHDETSVEQRDYHRELGMSVSEFPMTAETARAAVSNGEHVVMGAPNVVRGGSQNNALCAATAIRENMCTVIASDYYYPAQLIAAFKLVDTGVVGLANAWKLVSSSPAEAVGLGDRGIIQDGLRGDLVLVDAQTRQVRAVFTAGKMALRLSA